MKNNSIVKSAKFNVIVLSYWACLTSVANAQVQRTDTTRTTRDLTFRNSEIDTLNNINRQQNKSDSLPLPKGTDQMQGDNGDFDSSGKATYNIIDETDPGFSGAADWRTEESTTEVLRVYSGFH
ncbi:MAG: hypothetical protein IPN13_14305 [Bacteroidetes bacterium]|nr:hypothetical protein [Bacteroidota bacterium]